jgi:formylmethanofuran dehydrogenase subunit E
MTSNNYDQKTDGFWYSVNGSWLGPAEAPLGELYSENPIPDAMQVFDPERQRYLRVFGFRPNPHPRKTQTELDEIAAKMAEDAAALFEWQHFTTEPIYRAAAAEQGGLCKQCGTALDGQPITHYNNGHVFCRGCSRLQPRFGRP